MAAFLPPFYYPGAEEAVAVQTVLGVFADRCLRTEGVLEQDEGYQKTTEQSKFHSDSLLPGKGCG
jgi:hypothetical protein